MEFKSPFRDEDRAELKRLAVSYFKGGLSASVIEYAEKWEPAIKLFFRCIDREKGHYLRLPFDGSSQDQPVKTMEVLDFLQQLFLAEIKAHLDKLTIDAKKRGR